ncbi:cytosol aminopeptidase PepA [Oceaniovalibus guishaninsula JLT2003]|uniref:Probable cytosol aminopeptidase n=1 Tax=Oceaniovalibus guishaninsula JLT2003 TaxID=1231392 RepID=K2GTD6_9RHOB|nr:leucyl aminopeptidase [Oceaniovalibus guishaninsula]EKE45821.1 cytosol aminopeptidase PepA [Oceaniovalibus guishaninsula JLT2003]
MTAPAPLSFAATDLDALAGLEGHVAVIVDREGKLDPAGRRVNRLTRGAVERVVADAAFAKMKAGDVRELAYPSGMAADAVQIVRLDAKATAGDARKAGASIARAAGSKPVTILAGKARHAADLALGALLRGYDYRDQKTAQADDAKADRRITVMAADPDALSAAAADHAALAEGVFFTRDLVNAPANVLTTTAFARRLSELEELGLDVEVLEEDDLAELGMRTLLAVGQGSASPSKVVVMRWDGGGDAAPLALVGKGVVFDTGGISIKPAAGMEEMTMDMGGAGTVAGVMKTLALRKAAANVVGLVGIVENMPGPNATRPGDVVVSMKGDTVEIINTDAEGRLVLCDVMWYAQERFKPAAMIDLATLTGAIVIALGHENAGVFSNDDALCDAFLSAARAEDEGAWRMPLGEAYADQLKSRIADVKNVGGRPAGSVTAAEFLHRFVKDGTPWMHLDIAGVASTSSDSRYAPKGASGWGVRALDRLVRDRFEG